MDSSDSLIVIPDSEDSLCKPAALGTYHVNPQKDSKTKSSILLVIDEDDDFIMNCSSQKPTKLIHETSSDSDIQIIEPPSESSDSKFTTIKDIQTNIQDDCIYEPIPYYEEIDDEEWIELIENESKPSLLHSTPGKISRDSNLLKKRTCLKSNGKRINNRPKKQPTSKTISQTLFHFEKEDENRSRINLKKEDAVNHVTVCINSCLFELAEKQFIEIFTEKKLSYEVIKEDLNYCVRWKCRPLLEEFIKEVNLNGGHQMFKTVKISPINAIFDHLVILITSNQFHDYLDEFLDNSNDNPSGNIPNELFEMIKLNCDEYNIHNITLIIWKMEQHLKSQKRAMDDSFKRRVDLLLANDSQRPSKKKTKRNEHSNRHLLTIDNMELFLIDCKNKYLHHFHSDDIGQVCKFSILNIDTEQELAQTLYRYSRSLSEQIFRAFRQNQSNIELFASSNQSSAIDPKDTECRRSLWLRQIQQFPKISADIAEAIVNHFPSPRSLFNAFITCSSTSLNNNNHDPVNMLADIKTANNKRVGIELATKIYLFMTSNNPDRVLKGGNSS